MSYLSKSYQIDLDRAVDTPGHGKYIVDGVGSNTLRISGSENQTNEVQTLQ